MKKEYYHYSRVTGLKIFNDFSKIPGYMRREVSKSKDEAYAYFLKRKNDELQISIKNSERSIRQYQKQMQDNEKDFGYTKEMFPEVFI